MSYQFSTCTTLKTTSPHQLDKNARCLLPDIQESPILEDEDDEFDPVPPSVATTATTANSEQSTDSCDTSPDVISPTVSRCSEDLSQEPPDTPTSDALETAVLRDEGPDSLPAE